MKKSAILLLGVVFLAIVSSATAQGTLFVKAASAGGTGNDGDFGRFWGILVNVSTLVVEVNPSPSYDNVQELIKWTRLGEENAGNISALAWKSLLDLQNSGAKLHYTADELRSMASDISSNGLPPETVQALKDQGWSDDQINALVSYIREHSNEIVGDFDLGAYLEAFSDSFLEVGRKYSDYEVWALEKYYWRNALSNPPSGNTVSNPYVSSYEVNRLNYWASAKDADGLLSTVKSLRGDVEFVIRNAANAYYTSGGVKFQSVSLTSSGKTVWTYYWPNALNAYRLVSELYTIAVALKNGNSNGDLWDLVRQYEKELTSILGVQLVSTSFTPTPGPHPSPGPVPLGIDSCSPASYTAKNEPELVITDVKVMETGEDFVKGLVKYRVRVDYSVFGGPVMIDWASFNDGAVSKSSNPGQIAYPGAGSIQSPVFVVPLGDLQASVSGVVKIRYLPMTSPKGEIPNGGPGRPIRGYGNGDYPPQGAPALVMETYHGTLSLISEVDPGKVRFRVQAVKVGMGEVEYTARVSNFNPVPVKGTLTFYSTLPEENYLIGRVINRTEVTVMPNSEVTVDLGTVDYPRSGTYGFTGILSFEGFEKGYSGEVTITDPTTGGKGGELRIDNVKIGPLPPFEGDTVEFNVTVVNSYDSAENVSLRLVTTGKYGRELADLRNGTVGPHSVRTFTLYWSGLEGDYTYRVELSSNDGRIDSREGDLLVLPYSARNKLNVLGKLELSPSTAHIGKTEKVAVKIKLWDTRSKSTPRWEGHDVEIVDGRGVVWWPYKGRVFEHPRDVKTGEGYMYYDGVLNLHYGFNATLNTLLPVVNHNVTFYLVVDGHKVAASRLTVIDDNPVRAVMSCKPAVVSMDDHTTCTVYLQSNGGSIPTISEVYFGGKKVWPVERKDGVEVEDGYSPFGNSQIAVKKITIKINDELADYYFEKSPWLSRSSYNYRFSGYSYLVKAVFDGGIMTREVFEIADKSSSAGEKIETGVKVAGTAQSVLEEVAGRTGQLETVASGPLGKAVAKATPALNLISWGLTARDAINWLRAPTPSDGDNNNVIGG